MAEGQLSLKINRIYEELSNDESQMLNYLCSDLDGGCSKQDVKEVLKSQIKSGVVDHLVLAELLYRIRRFDLLKKILSSNKKQVEALLGSRLCTFSAYRVLMAEISEDLDKEDLRSVIFLLNDSIPKGRLDKATKTDWAALKWEWPTAQPEPSAMEQELGEEPPLREPRGEKPTLPEPREEVKKIPPPQPRPPPLKASPALPCVVPCPGIVDTLPECPDLPTLDLAPRSQHCQAQLFAWSLSQLPLKPQTSRHGSQTSLALPLPPTVFPLRLQTSLCRSTASHLCCAGPQPHPSACHSLLPVTGLRYSRPEQAVRVPPRRFSVPSRKRRRDQPTLKPARGRGRRLKKSDLRGFLDVVIELEKLDKVSPDKLDLIEQCLRHIHRKDLEKKVLKYMGSMAICPTHYQGEELAARASQDQAPQGRPQKLEMPAAAAKRQSSWDAILRVVMSN
ncbi:UNVERIFIED_CONTAM: hypothetical protein FKN15_038025 [Acipenser sinensis]